MSDAVLSFNLMVAIRRRTSSQSAMIEILIDVLFGFYYPAGAIAAPARAEHVKDLLFQVLDAGSGSCIPQVGNREDDLGKAMRVGRMDVAFDHVVAHQAVNDIGALAFGRAENQGVPEQVTFVHEGVGADPLALAKIFEGMVGVERIGSHLEFLAIARGMNFCFRSAINIGKVHRGHETGDPVVGGPEVFQGEAPIDGAVEFGGAQAMWRFAPSSLIRSHIQGQ